ncbi:MAG: hypothetical protein LIP02_06510 [Bacteroidales bacterium]|nr:hypothetical protein [Bacteroidales bacterium]
MKPTNNRNKGLRLALLDAARRIEKLVARYVSWCLKADQPRNPAAL